MEFMIPIIALWTFPTIGYWVIRLTKEKPNVRKMYFKTLFIACFFLVFNFLFKISTIFPLIDWVFLTLPYLILSSLLWTTRVLKQKVFRIIGMIGMVLVFGFGFFLSTVGILGLALILGDYKPAIKKILLKT